MIALPARIDLLSPRWLRPHDAAAYAGISVATLLRWAADANGPKAYRRGRVTLYDRLEIDEFLTTGHEPGRAA
jgi:predicted DNA-binding transcriptional regulator AlpA